MRADLDDAGIRSYLLGLLPEAEAEALEDAYLTSPEAWERVRGVEDDLLDDYAAGRLGPAEKGAFEKRYLASPPLRERLAAARALRMAATGRGRAPVTGAVTSRRARWHGPLAIAAGVLIAIVGFWNWPRTRQVTSVPSHSPSAAPSEAAPGPMPSPAGRSLVLALSPVLLRGQAPPSPLRIPTGTVTVIFALEGDRILLPPPPSALEMTIESLEGGPVWRGDVQRAEDAQRPQRLVVARVPAATLPPGDYIATLSVRGTDRGTLHRYFFRVAP